MSKTFVDGLLESGTLVTPSGWAYEDAPHTVMGLVKSDGSPATWNDYFGGSPDRFRPTAPPQAFSSATRAPACAVPYGGETRYTVSHTVGNAGQLLTPTIPTTDTPVAAVVPAIPIATLATVAQRYASSFINTLQHLEADGTYIANYETEVDPPHRLFRYSPGYGATYAYASRVADWTVRPVRGVLRFADNSVVTLTAADLSLVYEDEPFALQQLVYKYGSPVSIELEYSVALPEFCFDGNNPLAVNAYTERRYVEELGKLGYSAEDVSALRDAEYGASVAYALAWKELSAFRDAHPDLVCKYFASKPEERVRDQYGLDITWMTIPPDAPPAAGQLQQLRIEYETARNRFHALSAQMDRLEEYKPLGYRTSVEQFVLTGDFSASPAVFPVRLIFDSQGDDIITGYVQLDYSNYDLAYELDMFTITEVTDVRFGTVTWTVKDKTRAAAFSRDKLEVSYTHCPSMEPESVGFYIDGIYMLTVRPSHALVDILAMNRAVRFGEASLSFAAWDIGSKSLVNNPVKAKCSALGEYPVEDAQDFIIRMLEEQANPVDSADPYSSEYRYESHWWRLKEIQRIGVNGTAPLEVFGYTYTTSGTPSYVVREASTSAPLVYKTFIAQPYTFPVGAMQDRNFLAFSRLSLLHVPLQQEYNPSYSLPASGAYKIKVDPSLILWPEFRDVL